MAESKIKYREPRFCEKCGNRTEWKPVEDNSVLVETCPICGHHMFRNSKPCAGALILDAGKLLLIKRDIEPFKDFWDIPGGFLEESEHPRDGAIRETKEEAGVEIEPTEILGIFLDLYEGQGVTHNTYYIAKVIGGRAIAGEESKDVGWFEIDDLPENIAFPNHANEVLRLLREKLKDSLK